MVKKGSVEEIQKVIKDTNAHLCIDCGECTGSCPVSRVKPDYSPRVTVEKLLLGYFDEIRHDDDIWSCLTCGLCTSRCPSNVQYNDFVRFARKAVRCYTDNLNYAHNRILQKLMEIMAEGNPQNRTGWIEKDLAVSKKSKHLLFTGCLPYFEVVFRYLDLHPVNTAKDAVRILNGMGIKPMVSNEEVCCGKDLLFNGDEKNFIKLAKLNRRMIKESGAERIIFICPEGLETMKNIYPDYVGKLNVELVHITQLIDEAIGKGKLALGPSKYKKFTFQDPCSLGRGLGIYDAPRNIIKAIPDAELLPMEREREDSLCCGPSAWISCTNYTKRIQKVRLEQAERSGAEVMLTACPKCTIHLSCALSSDDIDLNIKIKDITTIVSEAMKGEHGKAK
jgi:heterodisulfide reductase subunit D